MENPFARRRQPHNVLLILTDQYRFPRFAYGPGGGMVDPIKLILGFQGDVDETNPYAKYFPGLLALRKNAVVLRRHMIAESACTPSRSAIMTGQYGTRTGVTQTDGLFKSGDAERFPWLAKDGVPTVGDWFRAAGYSTHYFGKWHVSNPPDHSLDEWGFDDWQLSYPEPHGSSVANLGFYRDIGFSDLITTFLRRKGLGVDYDRAQASGDEEYSRKPWFAVASFTNPHDIATWPLLPRQLDPDAKKLGELRKPLMIPRPGTMSEPPSPGTLQVPLNPMGFPQENAYPPPSQDDTLIGKPDCQYDYAYKIGMALASGVGKLRLAEHMALPFQLSDAPAAWALAYLQYYTFLHHVADGHIARVMHALDESGLRESTIVMFLADHGDYGVAHNMMIEKWHGAYEEVLHVPALVSGPSVNAGALRQIDALTSHIDVAPTLLGLAGFGPKTWAALGEKLDGRQTVVPFVGADLSPVIRGERPGDIEVEELSGEARKGVLFITDDMITEPLPPDDDPRNKADMEKYELYLEIVEDAKAKVPRLVSGPVRQPCHVRCLRTASWKLARYCDPGGGAADQWEMYSLDRDPLEMTNLLVYDAPSFPTVIAEERLPRGVSREEVAEAAAALRALLAEHEARMLPPASAKAT